MTSPIPAPTIPKSGGYQTESGIFTSISDLFRFFQPKRIKTSLSSPPLLKDLAEMEITYDKTTNKLWIRVDGAARYVQFT